MRSDLTCPIEVVDVRVERDTQEDSQGVICVIRFLNLTEKEVDSVQMNIICFDAEDARLGGRLVRAAVHTDGEERHVCGAFMPDHVDGAVRVEASVEKVWYKDGAVWRREERNVREYTPNSLPEGRELDRLRAVAGPDAMGYPYEEELLWLCVCGRANGIDEKTCFKCHRERAQVLKDYSYARIEATVGRRERDLEKQTMDNLRRSSEQTVRHMTAEQEKRRRRSRRTGTVIAILVLAVVGLSAWRWGVPYAAMFVAQDKLESGLSADAKAIFEWVDSHWSGQFGAADRAAQTEALIIEGLIARGGETELTEASRRAKALPAPEGTALYERAQLALAALAEKSGELDRAEEIYRAMADSEEAGKRLLALIYRAADEAQERVDYPTAIERFASLGDYEDAAERHEECIYLYGRQLLREGHYAQAAEQFLLVSGREDAIALVRQCYYAQAQAQQSAGEYIEAAALYESLGVYAQAESLARECRYAAGMEALEAAQAFAELDGREADETAALGDAAEQFALAGGYEDAAERFEAAAYELSARALEQGDPQTAVSWLERLPRSAKQIAALNAATYALAQKREADGDREQALLAFAALGDYEDAMERAHALEYGIAVDEMGASPESALARFEGLGDYADAQELAVRCRYLMGDESYAAGDYARAIGLFDALGNYQDSASKLRRSRYAQAGALREAGEYEEAAALYEACGAYLDAEELALRSRYDGAAAFEEQGDLGAAARAFAALGSYEDAPARARSAEDAWLSALYADAQMSMELGDYESVVAALGEVWQDELPARYADIAQLYVDACLSRADELIAMNRPLDALPLLENIADNASAQKRLSTDVYSVIGTWETASGARYVFRRDGTCSLNGREAYYGGRNYEIYIGDEPYPTKRGYGFVRLSNGTLTLREEESKSLIRMTYVGEPLDLVDEASDAPENGEEAAAQEPEDGEQEADAQAE